MNKVEYIKDELQKITAFCEIEMPIPLNSDCCEKEVVVCEVTRCDVDCLWEELKYLYRYISTLEDQLMNHMYDGHLPKIPGADKMQKAIDVLGLKDDYEVIKKQIYASDGSVKSTVFSITDK